MGWIKNIILNYSSFATTNLLALVSRDESLDTVVLVRLDCPSGAFSVTMARRFYS